MKNREVTSVPLLGRSWKFIGLAFFVFPVFFTLGSSMLGWQFLNLNVLDMVYSSWALGLFLLNLTREKVEDEMIKSIRLQAFQAGSYWLISGLSFIVLFDLIGELLLGVNGIQLSAGLVLFLLNAYIFVAFQYNKWKLSDPKDEE